MQLRLKLTLLLGAVIAVSVTSNYAIQRIAVVPSFRALEHEDAIEDWQRCQNAIARDQEALSALCFDWASWDDAYGFVLDKNPAFFDANLKNSEWFVDQKIDVLYFCRPDGTVYWRHVADLDSGAPATLAWMPADRLPPDHPLMAVTASKESRVDGMIRTELGFVMMSARPILTSKNEGPLAGVLVFGRRLNVETVAALREQTGVHFDIRDPAGPGLLARERAGVAEAIANDGPVEELIDADHLAVRGVVAGLDRTPVMLIQTSGERHISRRGHEALAFATWSLVASGLLTLVALLFAMRWLVIGPLGSLTRHATSVGESGHLGGRIDLKRSDELGTLARAYDRMLEQLEEFRANSVTMSRQAGMAEVAAGVLHNVGNAMTNVGVLAETLGSKVARSKASSLTKVSALLEEHKDDLPAFFGEGRQGQQLPGYIAQLADHLSSEMADVHRDLMGLREGLQHVKLIVASHQSIAKPSNFVEEVDLSEVVAGSLVLVEPSFRRHGIAVEVEAAPRSRVRCDRSKLSQVLVNLLTNAKEAMISAKIPAPRVRVRAGVDDGTAFVEVIDNGPGIDPQHRDRLFSKGFSTKAEGHGIGLHHSWLAVREMSGTLGVAEPEPGRGATFRLELPANAGAELVDA